MPGTVTILGNGLLLFCFPYDAQVNAALRDAAGNKVRWDPGNRGFTLSLSRLRGDQATIADVARFVLQHGLDPDAEARELLGLHQAHAPTLDTLALDAPGPGDLGPGRLHASLLPTTTWGSNLRGIFSNAEWDRLRIPVCTAAGNVCEVCGAEAHMDDGRKRRPDCHELWGFEHRDGRNIQRLTRLIALCPDCHRVQHIGLAGLKGETQLVIAKLRAVNGWTRRQTELELDRAEAEFVDRERYAWDLDLSALSDAVTIDGYPDLYISSAARNQLGNSFYG